jgi:heat shock protein HtpX
MHTQRLLGHKMYNLLQSVLLLGGMALLLMLLGWLIAGVVGVGVAAVGVVLLLSSQRVSPQLILRMYRARPLSAYEAPELVQIVHTLAQRAELPAMPRLYYIPSAIMNAFSVGQQGNAAIGVTDALLRRLTRRELVGVLAHEMSHIHHNDTWVMSLADIVSRLTSLLSLSGQFLLIISLPMLLLGNYRPPWLLYALLIFAPTLSTLLQLALSRTREFDADLEAIKLTGDPRGLASALAKLERYQRGMLERMRLPGHRIPAPSLLRTHPATEARIQRLLTLPDEPAPQDTQDTTVPHAVPLRPPAEDSPLALQMPQLIGGPRWRLTGLWF